MIRVLVVFIFISIISVCSIPVSAQPGRGRGFGFGRKQNPELVGKTIVNKLALYNASKYDSKRSGELLTHEKIKREMIEVIRFDLLSSYSRECPIQSPVISQDYATLISILLKNEKGTSKWDDGVLEYQFAIGISNSQLAKILCVISNTNNLVEIIQKNQKRADDALAEIYQLQADPYDEKKQDDYDRAVNIFEATNYLKDGILSGVLKKTDDALEDYEDAIELYPGFSEAYYLRAELNRGLSKNQEAISDYSQAIKFDNNESRYYIGRGICYFDMDQLENAMKDLNHVINLKPSDPVLFSAYAARGNIYERHKEDQKALQDYTKATDLNPKTAEIFFRKGILNRKLENYEASIKDFNTVIDLEKNHADAYFERGTTYAYLGDKKKVLSDYKTAAALGCERARDFLNSKNISWE